MKLAVFGATGMVGREVVAEALMRGHTVTAISRTSKPDSAVDGLVFVAADVRTGHYRRGTTTLLTDDHGDSRITAADLAAVVDELEEPGTAQTSRS